MEKTTDKTGGNEAAEMPDTVYIMEHAMDFYRELQEYKRTGLTPKQIEEQNRLMKAYARGLLLELPPFHVSQIVYVVHYDFPPLSPLIAECMVTGYEWTKKDGFCLEVNSTNRDQPIKIYKSIPFKDVDQIVFENCEKAGKKIDEIVAEKSKAKS